MSRVRVSNTSIRRVSLLKHAKTIGKHLETISRGRVFLHTVEREQLVDSLETSTSTGDSLPEVPIFTCLERHIKASYCLDKGPADDAGVDCKVAVAREEDKWVA